MTDPIFHSATTAAIDSVSPIEAILRHLEFARGYTLSLLEGLDDGDWFAQPAEGITHIAWQVGHIAMSQYGLTLFRQRGRAEVDLDLMKGAFRKKFSRGTTPDSDPSNYPSPMEIREVLDKVFEQAKVELPTFSLESLNEEVDPPHAAFATKYGALLFSVDHEMLHAGQIGLIRRLIGKAPLR